MTHPWHLHATAALLSLHAALTHLAAAQERVARVRWRLTDGVQAWRPNSVLVAGGGGIANDGGLLAAASRDNPAAPEAAYLASLAERALEGVDGARWLIFAAIRQMPHDWDSTRQAISLVDPGTARAMLAWLRPPDDAVRKALHLDRDEAPILPANPECPNCTVRLLRLRPASGMVVCTAGCRCRGDGCPCGMLVREQGVPHIWLGRPKEAL